MKELKYFQKNLLFLSLLSFILVSSSALNNSVEKKVQPKVIFENEYFAPLPVLGENTTIPSLSSESAIVLDLESGVTLYEKNPDIHMLPASTAKIITALVVLDYYPLDLVLTAGDINVEGQKMKLVKGEKVIVEDLLYGLLMFSANDAAEVLAQNFPGGRDLFIAAMNLKVQQLDLENTYIVNPAGLDGAGQYTSARDLARVSQVAMGNKYLAKIVGTKERLVKSIDGKHLHKLTNINELVGEVDGVLGVKTGWTENAKENLVTYIERDQKKVMLVVLGSEDRFGETKILIDWLFENYSWEEVSYY